MSDVSDAMDAMFQSLFYGSGAWLGLLILLCLAVALTLRWKEAGLLMVPVTLFMGIEYLSHSLGWHAVIMFLSSTIIVISFAQRRKGE